jgi:hypothetical protein
VIRRHAILILTLLASMAIASHASAASIGLPAHLDDSGSCVSGGDSAGVVRSSDAGRQHTDQGLSIDQPVIDVRQDLAPGDSFTCYITIRNRRSTPAIYDISTVGLLGSRTEQTRIVPIDAREIGATAAQWIDPVVNSIALKAEESARIPVVVTVPPDPPTGGVYASIQFIARQKTRASGEQAQVGVTSGAAASLLLHVGGTGRAKLAFHDTRTHKLRTSRASWTWRARLDNDGTVEALPSGRVRVRSIFGRTIARFDIHTRPLLPKGGAPVAVTWKGTPWFGVYRWDARVGAAGDATARPATASGWIVALPPWWIVALVLLIAIAVIAWPIVRRRREWRNYIEDDDAPLDDDRPHHVH